MFCSPHPSRVWCDSLPRDSLSFGQSGPGFWNVCLSSWFQKYCQPGPVGHRGVGILVRKALRCKRMKKWSHDDAQAIAVMVDGAILVSMYVSCSGHAPELQGEVLEFLTREYKHVPWFLFGDHKMSFLKPTSFPKFWWMRVHPCWLCVMRTVSRCPRGTMGLDVLTMG